MNLTKLFREFFNSEKTGGLILIICTIISLLLTNAIPSLNYSHFWHLNLFGISLIHVINDLLMSVFFLLIGLELEREIYKGELSNWKSAMLPVGSAFGGMIVPAAIYLIFNFGKSTQAGLGIPMATDIAFAIGILSLLGSRVPSSLKVFLTALAVVDDLGAILFIAVFYTSEFSLLYLSSALLVLVILFILNRFRVNKLSPYLIGGAVMWYFMYQSGIHATISGVLLAFVIPFGSGGEKSLSYRIQHFLHRPVAYFILPLFALANTAITLNSNSVHSYTDSSSIGIIAGLLLGKPIGITIFAILAVAMKITVLPNEIKWSNIIGVGFIAGIGFTMSIFITLLAFQDFEIVNNSKIMILTASLTAGLIGYFWLKFTLPKAQTDNED